MNNTTLFLAVFGGLFSVFLTPYIIAYAYDMPELIDPPRTATQKSIEPQVYRFAELEMQNVTYSNGNVYPSMTAEIQKYNFTSKQWETYGYTNQHLHNVKVDGTDVVDISVGQTTRINPKN